MSNRMQSRKKEAEGQREIDLQRKKNLRQRGRLRRRMENRKILLRREGRKERQEALDMRKERRRLLRKSLLERWTLALGK